MPIVSISVTSELLKEMNNLEKSEGFSGRSDLIRAGVRELINLKQERTSLTGELQSILIITHEEGKEQSVTKIKHGFDNIIQSHMHFKLGDKKCLELFVLHGQASNISDLVKQFQISDSMDKIKLITA